MTNQFSAETQKILADIASAKAWAIAHVWIAVGVALAAGFIFGKL